MNTSKNARIKEVHLPTFSEQGKQNRHFTFNSLSNFVTTIHYNGKSERVEYGQTLALTNYDGNWEKSIEASTDKEIKYIQDNAIDVFKNYDKVTINVDNGELSNIYLPSIDNNPHLTINSTSSEDIDVYSKHWSLKIPANSSYKFYRRNGKWYVHSKGRL